MFPLIGQLASSVTDMIGGAGNRVAGAVAGMIGGATERAGIIAVEAAAPSISASASALATGAVTSAYNAAEEALKVAGYKTLGRQIQSVISNAQAAMRETPAGQAIIANPQTGVQALFDINRELQNLIQNPQATSQAFAGIQTRLQAALNAAEIHVNGLFAFGTRQERAQPVRSLADRLNPPQDLAPRRTVRELNAQLDQKLTHLTTCLKRKIEVSTVFNGHAPDALLNQINAAHPEQYNQAFRIALNQKVQRDGTPTYLRGIKKLYLNIKCFFVSSIVSIMLPKIETTLKDNLRAFLTQDRDSIMDVLSQTLFQGLELYSQEIITSSRKILQNNPRGTVCNMFQQDLASSEYLNGGFKTDKELYSQVTDLILAKTFTWSLSRWVVKKFINFSGVLENPWKSIYPSIRNTNGFYTAIDKGIINLIKPLIANLKAPRAAAADPAAAAAETRGYSDDTKRILKNAIQNALPAVDLLGAANTGVIGQILATRVDNQTTTKDSMIDGLVSMTAEATALSTLKSLHSIMNEQFLLETVVDILDITNASFAAQDVITEQEQRATEEERSRVLNEWAEITTTQAIDDAPYLNAEKTHQKMNERLAAILEAARPEAGALRAHIEGAEGQNRPDEILQRNVGLLQTLRQATTQYALTHGLTAPQIEALTFAQNEFEERINQYVDAYDIEDAEAKNEALSQAINALEASLVGPIFTPKAFVSLVPIKPLKKGLSQLINFIAAGKLKKGYDFVVNPLTIKYLVGHQPLSVILGTRV